MGLNKEKEHKRRERFYQNHPNYHRSWELKKKYGITLDDYNKILSGQGGVCFLCKSLETVKKRIKDEVAPLSVDHCHKTGQVRSLLCRKCNLIVAAVENPKVPLEEYINYVKKHKENSECK